MRMTEADGRGRARLRNRSRLIASKGARGTQAPPTLILDSAGTVLDSMGPRHSLAYFPAFADAFFKDSDRAALEEVWSFVAIRSRYRSAGRFRLLASALRLARRHPRIVSRHEREEKVAAALDHWIASERSPSASAIERALRDRSSGEALVTAAIWSLDVDARLSALPPPRAFEGAVEALRTLAGRARIVVVGEGRSLDTERDWRRAGLLGPALGGGEIVFVGEEGGSVEEIALAAKAYARGPVLVVGDSPVELEAARSAGTVFYPIKPGRERESWLALAKDFFPAFARGERAIADSAGFLALFASGPDWRAARG
jgi:phosphoglycolate phosphatase-like HAD superfamily hydrolase